MTIEEIKNTKRRAFELAVGGDEEANKRLPLWEIAYQLAVMNEAKSKERTEYEGEVEYACGFASPGGFEESHRTTSRAEAEQWASRGALNGGSFTMHVYGIRVLPRVDIKPDWFATIQARDLAKRTDREQST